MIHWEATPSFRMLQLRQEAAQQTALEKLRLIPPSWRPSVKHRIHPNTALQNPLALLLHQNS